jgi:hypothetical protein
MHLKTFLYSFKIKILYYFILKVIDEIYFYKCYIFKCSSILQDLSPHVIKYVQCEFYVCEHVTRQ